MVLNLLKAVGRARWMSDAGRSRLSRVRCCQLLTGMVLARSGRIHATACAKLAKATARSWEVGLVRVGPY